MPKPKSEIIKFDSNKPMSVVLDTDPRSAKSTTRESQWGVKTSYTYFVKDNKVFFASQALHDKLLNYAKGDTVTINLVDGKLWSVSSDGAGAKRDAEIHDNLAKTETTILLRKIALDIDLIKNHLFGTNTNEAKKDKLPGDEDEIDF